MCMDYVVTAIKPTSFTTLVLATSPVLKSLTSLLRMQSCPNKLAYKEGIKGKRRLPAYCSAKAFTAIPIRPVGHLSAYGRMDAFDRVTGLEIELLGETSIASTISSLHDANVFIGSSYGDSQVSVELEGIKGMWSLRSSTDNPFDTFLVVSFISETRILAINLENELEETEIDGLNSQVRTLFCHDAVYDQLVQVRFGVKLAAVQNEHTVDEVCHSKLCRLVSSISRELRDEWNAPSGYSINVATANATQSPLLNLLQISYVLCALGSGVLLTFQLDDSGKLTNRKEFTLGDTAHDVMYFLLQEWHTDFFYNEVNMKNVNYVCPFNLAAFPDSHSLAIAKQEQLIIGSSDFIRKLHIQTIQLNEQAQRICHQDKSDTFAICNQKFDFIANYPLNAFEYGSSMTSCSFSDDSNIYYCVGTAYDLIEEMSKQRCHLFCSTFILISALKGRILVFFVEDENLQLIAEKETKGTVFSLNAFHGKLLASFNKRIDLYNGDFILVNCLGQTYELFIYTEGALKKEVIILHDHALSAIAILDDDLYLAAQSSFNLVICRVDDRVNDEPKIWYDEPNVLSKCHLGELVSCFHHGFLSLDSVQIPRVVFGTVNGAIGIVASLPREQFIFLEKLQSSLREVIKSVGGLSHEQWRDSFKGAGTKEPNNFLDGDLIEMFTHLSQDQMEKISESVEVTVEEISNIVDELIRLH
ncbi:hypothetical protein GQ457_01G000190 [Hibiscus cannabinus]